MIALLTGTIASAVRPYRQFCRHDRFREICDVPPGRQGEALPLRENHNPIYNNLKYDHASIRNSKDTAAGIVHGGAAGAARRRPGRHRL
jgi:hypothetical protein